ncbi:MAG TPA: glycoside hydrolase domain-containing protein [Bacteroidales bacterium]|nr:glycoside hydrolase domain-containing protein [Bacteroidales bacterium]
MRISLFKNATKVMIYTFLMSFLLIQYGCTESHDTDYLKFVYVDPLEKVLAEASYIPDRQAVSEVVRGEHATLQFVIRSPYSISDLRVKVSPAIMDGKALPEAKTGFVGYVKVGRSIWDYSRDRIVSPSGYYPDPIVEQESVSVDFGNTQPIWISIPIPKDASAGIYKGTVTVTGVNGRKKFKLSEEYTIKVYPVTIEKTSLWVTNWFSINPAQLQWMNGGNLFEEYSDQHWEYIRTLARKMADYRQNVAIISPIALSEYKYENGRWNIDFTRFDRVVEIFINEGVIGRIEGGHIGGRESTWLSNFVVTVPSKEDDPENEFLNLPISDPAAREFYTAFFPALNSHLKEKGWDKIYIQHLADEPIEENIKSYIEIAKFVRKLVPDFKFIDACHSKNLGDVLDIWVPQLDFMDRDYSFYNDQNLKGKEAWFYTCLSPKGEYVNRFIELPLLRTRYMHWINYKYNIPGYLHWGLNYWNNSDPFGEQTSIQYEGGNILPGGDSWIIYPKDGKLFSSIRSDAMRDGIVDYELFRMLEKKDSVKARGIINKVIYSFNRYDNNIEAFRVHRREIMELLSEE